MTDKTKGNIIVVSMWAVGLVTGLIFSNGAYHKGRSDAFEEAANMLEEELVTTKKEIELDKVETQ